MRYSTGSRSRRGTILPLLAITCFALFAFIALAVDLGMLMVARTECQNAADTAALTGARTLDNDVPFGVPAVSYDNKRPLAIAAATSTVQANFLMQSNFAFNDTSVDNVEIGIYDYDSVAQVFSPIFHPANAPDPTAKINGRPWTAVRVTVKGDQPTYFARIFGISTMPMIARATATHRPRDIALVLDFSGSMKFGCVSHYPPGTAGSTGTVIGLLNPDPRFPQFGHYQRYDGRSTNTPNGSNQHPFHTTTYYTASSGEIFSPNNQTWESSGGPPMVNDYYTSPNANPAAPVVAATLVSAFNNSVTPASTNYNTQDLVSISGDRWPRKRGQRFTTGVTWDPANSQGSARNVAELVFSSSGYTYPNTPSAPAIRTIVTTGSPARLAVVSSGNLVEGGTSWANFRDDGWERNGYDLNLPSYISSNYASAPMRTTELFQGYTMGPGYWGKTFFIWPPDPRFAGSPASSTNIRTPDPDRLSHDTSGQPMCDWRRRFFLRGNGTAFDPQSDNNPNSSGEQSINGTLLNTVAGGHVLGNAANYQINYRAVLAWLKSGPQTLPSNLRAGRILFYTQIPDDCSSPSNDDERFWREYIDYVIGDTSRRSWYDPRYCLAGTETSAWGKFRVSATTSAWVPTTGARIPNPRPYMDYCDTPNMPRAHFWFGPQTMLMFLATRGQPGKEWNFQPGTVREAQSWQLKAAVQSAIDDIRKNHPNDQCGMAFFAHANFSSPRVAMGQDWDRLKAALFYPNTFLSDVLAGNNREERPYSSDNNFNARLVGNIPNANGGTDPNNGLCQAYNLLSTSTAVGAGGRRGAAKIVFFETDGVPNAYQNWDFISAGSNSRYNWISSGAGVGNGGTQAMQEAYDAVTQICRSTTDTNPGFSLPNAPARVYPFGFGDMFTPECTSSFKPTALTFLQTIAYNGNTNTTTSTLLPTEQVITGNYATRISNLRIGLERCLQNGVQVTLIE